MSSNSWVEISENSILNNIEKISNKSKEKNLMAIVKANAYGLGIESIVPILEKANVSAYGVANLYEALELRKLVPNKKILILGPIDIKSINLAEKNNIDITVHSIQYLKKIRCYIKNKLNVHLKISLSMNRIGFKSLEELKEVIKIIKKSKVLQQEGLFSHFSTGIKKRCKVYKKDLKELKKIIKEININDFNLVHFSNSATVLSKKNIEFENTIRIGIAMYGFIENDLELEKSVKIKSKIIQIKKMKKGSYISYNSKYKVKKNAIIATIPLGYADGVLRSNINKVIEIRNKDYNIVGDICMDYIMVLVDPSIRVFDTIEIDLMKLSKSQKTIIYEVLTCLSIRLKRKIL